MKNLSKVGEKLYIESPVTHASPSPRSKLERKSIKITSLFRLQVDSIHQFWCFWNKASSLITVKIEAPSDSVCKWWCGVFMRFCFFCNSIILWVNEITSHYARQDQLESETNFLKWEKIMLKQGQWNYFWFYSVFKMEEIISEKNKRSIWDC